MDSSTTITTPGVPHDLIVEANPRLDTWLLARCGGLAENAQMRLRWGDRGCLLAKRRGDIEVDGIRVSLLWDGTPLMQTAQAIGIDLPLKAPVFEDAAGKVWLTYNDPRWLAQRHGLGAAVTLAVGTMPAARDAIAAKATKPS